MNGHKNDNRCSHCLEMSINNRPIIHKPTCTNIGPRVPKVKHFRELNETQKEMLQIMYDNTDNPFTITYKIENMIGDLLIIKKYLIKTKNMSQLRDFTKGDNIETENICSI